MTPLVVIERITGRWSLETTFQEMRPYLGLETTRGRTEATVLWLVPCLFGLFSVVALLYDPLPKRSRSKARVDRPRKVETTSSHAITEIRRWLRVDWVFAHQGFSDAFSNSHSPFRRPCFRLWHRRRRIREGAKVELRGYPRSPRPMVGSR